MTVFSTNLFGPSVRGAGRWLFARIERLPRPGYFLWAYPGYLNRYWRYMLALSSTSASVTWVRPREATRSSIRLRIKRRIRKGLRLMRRSASGSQVICCPSGNVDLFRRVEECSCPHFTPADGTKSSDRIGTPGGSWQTQPICHWFPRCGRRIATSSLVDLNPKFQHNPYATVMACTLGGCGLCRLSWRIASTRNATAGSSDGLPNWTFSDPRSPLTNCRLTCFMSLGPAAWARLPCSASSSTPAKRLASRRATWTRETWSLPPTLL